MPVATTNQLIVKTRDEWIALYLRSIKVRNPQESIEPNSPAWIRACAIADCLVMQSATAQATAAGVLIKNQNEDQLVATGEILGIDWPAAVGASGNVIASTGTLGSTILAGDEIVNLTTKVRYHVTTTALYNNGDPIPVIGTDTGPLTNVDPGVPLTWSAPRPGCLSTALVQELDGEGLSGGSDKASADEYRKILAYALANESASGNEATLIKLAENSRAHGVSVQKAFVYPSINGPGTVGLCFAIKPKNSQSSRIPNGTQMAAVLGYVTQWLPGDDDVFMLPLVAAPLSFVWRVKWSASDAGWADAYPWPQYIYSDSHIITGATDASHFFIGTLSGSYSGVAAPTAGKTIAIFSASTGTFYRKKIFSAGGGGPWTIVCDTTAAQSDTSYTPSVNDVVSPWADSLPVVEQTVADYIGAMGPGQQVSSDPGDGRRMMRMPTPTSSIYPIQVSSLVVSRMLDNSAIDDTQELNALGQVVPLGVYMTTSKIFEQPTISVYPL